jgi:hypothetical protein
MPKIKILFIIVFAFSLSACTLPWSKNELNSNTNQPNINQVNNNENTSAYDSDSWKTLIAENCLRFNDGCNDCFRNETGATPGCTKKACAVYQKPTCSDTPDEVTNGSDQLIELGTEFTLRKNESAIVQNIGYKITITNFFNSPCPDGAQCLWSGVGVTLKHSLKGEVKEGIDMTEAFGYKTTIIDTDHETYAKLKINSAQNIADLTSCKTDADCVPATCCHPTSVVNQKYAPDCAAIACDLSCQVPLDCGEAKIACQNNKCVIIK